MLLRILSKTSFYFMPVWIRRFARLRLQITFRSFFFFLVPAALFDQVNYEQCTDVLFTFELSTIAGLKKKKRKKKRKNA